MIFGKKALLSPVIPSDIQRIYQWNDDLDDARLNEPYRPANWQHVEDFWLNSDGEPSRVFFAVRAVPDPAIVGFVQIRDIQLIHHSATIGLKIGEPADRGKGLGREALSLAIDYCWRHLNLSRLEINVFATNDPAVGLYRSLGFLEEGRKLNALFIDGSWVDLIIMARLRDDRVAA